MSAQPKVIVVVPTYNERDTVAILVAELLEVRCRPDVLVVDDNSPDGTGAVVRSLASGPGRDRVYLLSRPNKAGLGPAYSHGFGHVRQLGAYDVVVQMDADGSHATADVDRLVAATDDADLVIGSRYVPGGGSQGLSRPRWLLSRGGNAYARLVLGIGVHDVTGGFKAWSTDLLDRVDPVSAACDGYGFQIELTLRATRLGARVVEIPIEFAPRRAGTSKMTGKVAAEALALVPWMSHHYRRGWHPILDGPTGAGPPGGRITRRAV